MQTCNGSANGTVSARSSLAARLWLFLGAKLLGQNLCLPLSKGAPLPLKYSRTHLQCKGLVPCVSHLLLRLRQQLGQLLGLGAQGLQLPLQPRTLRLAALPLRLQCRSCREYKSLAAPRYGQGLEIATEEALWQTVGISRYDKTGLHGG